MSKKEVYLLEPEKVFSELNTKKDGLSKIEVKKRRTRFGANELERKRKISPLKIFLSQFKDPLVIILIIAVLISAFILKHIVDSIVILAIVILNSGLGFRQEYKAEKALELLRKLSSPHSRVIRDGKDLIIPSKNLVPGDILLIEAGDKIPADARLFETIELHANESSLTGESTPVAKHTHAISKETIIAERRNMVFAGTIITQGKGRAIVTKTGFHSELGKIADMVHSIDVTKTPLQHRMERFSKWIGIIVLAITATIFFVGFLIKHMEFQETFLASLSLAISAIPEGLPAVITISLSLGMSRMLKKKALIRRMKSVETLGSVTIICSDKTGTITKNEMTATRLYVNGTFINISNKGFEENNKVINPNKFRELIRACLNCNDASMDIGDPTEIALLKLANKAGHKTPDERTTEIPFSSDTKFMATIHKNGLTYMKGAPEVILGKCKHILIDGKKRMLTKKDKDSILSNNNSMANDSLRVLGFAYSKRKGKDFIFIGLVGMIDPPRENVHESIRLCKIAGIRTIMITGDHQTTAESIAKKVGIKGKVMTGTEMDQISDKKLKSVVRDHSIFARTTSEHKVRILKALQSNGEIVAMTGDGVNDAPALKKSDVGIAMNIRGTDVSREVSDIILLDDNFSSIVSAVKEGRTIYDNIKKFIKFLLTANCDEVLLTLTTIIMGFSFLPLLPLQILWINLVTDSLPALALGVDPAEKDIMHRKPRHPKESLFHNIKLFIFSGATIAFISSFLIFYFTFESGAPVAKIQTITMTKIIIFQLFLVFTCRSSTQPLYKVGLMTNKKLIYAVVAGFISVLVIIYTPLNIAFGTVPLNLTDWGRILLYSLTGIGFFEIIKTVKSLIRK